MHKFRRICFNRIHIFYITYRVSIDGSLISPILSKKLIGTGFSFYNNDVSRFAVNFTRLFKRAILLPTGLEIVTVIYFTF